jgi:aminomethyltransferase
MLPAAEAPDLWRALEIAGVTAAGLGARDTLRLEAGLNLYGQDMDESVSPMECGLAWTVNLAMERDFVGRAGLTLHPARHQLGLVVLGRGMVRSHQVVKTVAGEGVVTSGGFAPTLGCSIALARVPTAVSAGESVEVEARGKRLAAKTVTPPFVRHGKILINVARSASNVQR